MTSSPADAGPVTVALAVNHPAQYFAPAFRALAAERTVRPRIYFWHENTDGVFEKGFGRHVRWRTDLHSGYDWWCPPASVGPLRRGRTVLRRLWRDRPDVVLAFGWASPVARLGIAFAVATGTPLLVYGDTNGRAAHSCRRGGLRGMALRRLFAAAGAVATGGANREFYRGFGMAEERIHSGVLPIELDPFLAASTRRRVDAAPAGPLVIGFVGKLLAAKAPDDLLTAVTRLPEDRPWEVWFVGDGPLRSHLESVVDRLGLRDRVRFLGFRNTDEVPGLMAAFDVLVLPSRWEPRGLVAVEALAAGTATVVSSATGVWGQGDAIEDGTTGLVYPASDIGALASCLRRLLDDAGLRRRLAANGQARAAAHGPSQFAATTSAALRKTVRRHTRVVAG